MWNRIEASVEIEAPIDAVWGVLSDSRAYDAWSDFLLGVEPPLDAVDVGDPITLRVRMHPARKRPMRVAEVLTAKAPYELAWRYRGMPRWLLRAERFQRLEPLAGDRTRYVTHETFEGPLAPLVIWTQSRLVRGGFERTAQALKRHVEQARH